MIKKIYKIIKNVENRIKESRALRYENKKIKEKRRIEIQNTVVLTSKQKRQIDSFYKKYYGKKIKYNWHKEYYAISGIFDYKYFPELLYIPKFERLLNSPDYYNCLQDKNILEIIGKAYGNGLVVPKVYVRCANGILLDGEYNVILEDEAIDILKNIDAFFIKPSVGSSSGRGCRIIKKEEFLVIKDKLFKEYGKDFIIQEVLKNSEEIAKLNESSINTFRVITYILDGKIYHMPLLLRIGRNGKFLDNAHQGGMFIGVSDEGYLDKCAHTEFNEKFLEHPDSKIVFEHYHISGVDKIIQIAHKLQGMIPHVGCINWDLTINDKNEVVLIEANMRGGSIWLVQMTGKSGFGDNTARVLEVINNNKELF